MKSFKTYLIENAPPHVERRRLKGNETVWYRVNTDHTITFEGEKLSPTSWYGKEASPIPNIAVLYTNKEGTKAAWFAQADDASDKKQVHLILNPHDLIRQSIRNQKTPIDYSEPSVWASIKNAFKNW